MSAGAQIDVYKDWLGIPPGPRPPDHYELLRLVRFEDDAEKIRAHYRKLNAHVKKYQTGPYSTRSQELLNELARTMLCLTDAERKRDYDRSLGREFAEERDEFGRVAIEDVLVRQGRITHAQVSEARQFADVRGLSMRDALVQMKLVGHETAAAALAESLNRSYVDLAEMFPDDSVLDMVPRRLVKRHTILPLFVDDDMVLVACIDDLEPELEEELHLRFDMPVRAVIATPLAINQAIARYYAPGMRDEESEPAAKKSNKTTKAGGETKKPEGKTARKAAPPPKPAKPARKGMDALNPEQAKFRKQLGILIMCWTTIASVLIDNYVIRTMFFPRWSWLLLVTPLVAPIAVSWVLKVYWKK